MKVYFWVKLERTTGKTCMSGAGKVWYPSSSCDNSDAQATGLFGDFVEGVYFSTVLSGQKEHDIRQRFQAEVGWLAMECRYEKYTVVTISETDYFALTRKYAEARLEAMGVTKAAIDRIKANDRSVIERVMDGEYVEMESLIEQLTANFKEAK
jgi:hypothetical protein